MMHRVTQHRGRGFTLVEALIVVSLVFTLITIAAPVLAGARGTAQRTVCLSNLRQLAGATHLYMDIENRGVLPASPSVHAARPDERRRAYRGELLLDQLADFIGGPSLPDGAGGFARKLPHACPADTTYATKIGFSYDFHAGLHMEEPLTMRVTSEMARRVTTFYMNGERVASRTASPRLPRLFDDIGPYHHAAPPGTQGINAVYFDTSAGWSRVPVHIEY